MAKHRPISTLSIPCPTCGAPPRTRCLSLKPGVMLKRQYAEMLIDGENRLIKSHASRRLMAGPTRKSRAEGPR